MNTNNKLPISQDNLLTTSKYKFTTIEGRCFGVIIEQVRKTHNITPIHPFQEIIQKQLLAPSEFTSLTIPAASFSQAGARHDEILNSLKHLIDKKITIDSPKVKLITPVLAAVKYYKERQEYEINIHSVLIPFMVELTHNFTTYDLQVLNSFSSSYSQRFYQFCCMYEYLGEFQFTTDELRDMFYLADKFLRGNDFKNYVLDQAQNEIKQSYDKGEAELFFEYIESEKKGKKATKFKFTIHTDKEVKKIKNRYPAPSVTDKKENELREHYVTRLTYMLIFYFRNEKEYIEKVMGYISQKHTKTLVEMFNLLDRIAQDSTITSKVRYIRKVLKENYCI